MQCPNCHKEAINVNGKFVCLDCGIEISPSTVGVAEPPAQAISIANHGPIPVPDNNVSSAVPSDVSPAQVTPVVQDTTEEPLTPIKDAFEKELDATTGPVQDFPASTADDSSIKNEIPDFPPTVGGAADSKPTIAESSKLDLSMDSSFTTPEPAPVQTETEPIVAPEPDLPKSPVIEPTEPVQTPEVPTPVSPEPIIPTTELLDSASVTPDPVIPLNVPETTPVLPETPMPVVPTLDNDVQQAAPENYFQPQEMSIAPQPGSDPQSSSGDNFDALSTPSGIAPNEPMVGSLDDQALPTQAALVTPDFPETPAQTESMSIAQPEPAYQDTVSNPIEPEASAATNQQPINDVATGQNLDDLLDMYSSTPQTETQATVSQSIPNQMNSGPFDTVQGVSQSGNTADAVPPGQVPSYESVFGGTAKSPEAPVVVATTKNSFLNKKTLLIIGSVILGIMVMGGVVFGVAKLLGNKEVTEDASSVANEEISVKVQTAMEANISAEVSYNQTIDFSKIETATGASPELASAINSLKTAPSTNRGSWKIAESGNTELNAVINGTNDKEIYLKEGSSTYVFNNVTSSWVKKDGFMINSIPGFYGAESRGKLFYLAQLESIESAGQEAINGVSLEKYKIKANPDFVESIILKSSPALAGVSFTSLNVDNLEVFAWLDGEGKIYKVSATGKVQVESDSLMGAVSLQSEAEYAYRDNIEVKSPIAQNIPAPITPVIAETLVEKDTEVKPIQTTVIKASEKIEGRG